jgi:predicted nucleic acid-binding protein
MAVAPHAAVCLDASLAVAIALPEPLSARALAAWQQWLEEERVVVAPPHFGAELLSAVRRAVVLGRVTPDEEVRCLELCLRVILPNVEPRWPDAGTWQRTWLWAERLRRSTVYDSLYLAVAEETGAGYWTADANLVRALQADGQAVPHWVHLLEP